MSEKTMDVTGLPEVDEFGEVNAGSTDMADAAAESISDLAAQGYEGTQDVLDDTDFLKVRFVGMSFDSLDKSIEIGDPGVFLVRARCTGTALEQSASDGSIRSIAKMKVDSVIVFEEE